MDGTINPVQGASEGALPTLGIMTSIVSPLDLDFRRINAVNRRYTLQSTARALLPNWRVASCLRNLRGTLVNVVYHPAHAIASYSGLHVCANVHVCPVCGGKVAGRRAEEVNRAINIWVERGGGLVMATFTLRHAAGDTLAQVAGALNEAYRKMRAGKGWQQLEAMYGLVGSITSREYTHGVNGWHPHLHALLLLAGGLSRRQLAKLEGQLKERWAAALVALGRDASWQHGVRVTIGNGDALADYVTKTGRQWTLGDELTRAVSKTAARGGRSIAQLLWLAGLGDPEAVELFKEYADWTYRKNALVWSPGLRKLLGLGQEASDQELAEAELEHGRVLVMLLRRQWLIILQNDARAELLLAAAMGDVECVVAYCAELGIELGDWQLLPGVAGGGDDLVGDGLSDLVGDGLSNLAGDELLGLLGDK